MSHYLANKYQPSLALSPSEAAYPEFLNWMYFADATLTFPQAVVLRYTQLQPGRADLAAQDYAAFFIGRLRKLDAILLDGREFLVEGCFTVADVCVAYPLMLGRTLQVGGKTLSDSYKPQTAAYLARMMARPAFGRAQAMQEESFKAFDKNKAKDKEG